MVDGAIGEDSMFHQTFGYYGQGVTVTTATLPAGWEDRLVSFNPPDSEPAEALCLDPVDLVVAKLVAGREKDFAFAAELLPSCWRAGRSTRLISVSGLSFYGPSVPSADGWLDISTALCVFTPEESPIPRSAGLKRVLDGRSRKSGHRPMVGGRFNDQ